MGNASLQFLGFGLLVVLIFNVSQARAWRQSVLCIASLSFLAFFSTDLLSWVPFAGFVLFGFASVKLMQSGRRGAFVPILATGIVAFVWLKKYTFLPGASFLPFPYVTLGLSYIFFRVLHVIIDAKDGNITAPVGFVSYLNYTVNFTTLVSGPIQRYQDFAEMQLAPVPLPLDIVIAGQAFERILIGFFKVNVLSLFLSMARAQALAELTPGQSLQERVSAGIIIAAGYPLYLYCNFSGYIDIVIGMARFLRLELPENFNRPFASDNFLNFWSRWHITLSSWLKTYVYNPLLIALMRRYSSPSVEPFLGVFAFFVTFFLVGVWHGQTSVFIFFGVLQGLGVSVTKLYQIMMGRWLGRKAYKALGSHGVYNAVARGFTFTWFAFTLLWFWSDWKQLGALSSALGPTAILVLWSAIFVGATLVLAFWEGLRSWLLSFEWESSPILLSRYVRTVWDTALVVIAGAIMMLLNAPAPDIVYKAF